MPPLNRPLQAKLQLRVALQRENPPPQQTPARDEGGGAEHTGLMWKKYGGNAGDELLGRVRAVRIGLLRS